MERLSKILARSGIASRRKCEDIISSGSVIVNGCKVILPQLMVDPMQDTILVNGQSISLEKKVYYALNKPKGYVCSPIIGRPYKMALDLIPDNARLFMVGRLDKDTTGLLLITNDGHFANRVIHPSYNIDKEYLVKTSSVITDVEIKKLLSGIWLLGSFIKPKKVIKMRRGTLKIVVKEGKKHEVRRMVRAAGLSLKELTRIRIGPLVLGSLPVGNYRPLTPKEINLFL